MNSKSSGVETSSSTRIARNTLMLYIRMLLSVVIGLYTSRVVLHTLGVEDYGVLGVVGSVVSFLSFLDISLCSSSQRFISIALGQGLRSVVQSTFNAALQSHLIIASCVALLLETIGLWVLSHYLVIPSDRMVASYWIFHLSVLSTFLGICLSPFTAFLMSVEKMDVYAWLEISSVMLKLFVVWLLQVVSFDRLIAYSIFTFLASVLIRGISIIYCFVHFPESRLQSSFHTQIILKILNFSGLTLFADASDVVRQQGINVLLNRFWGVVINASCGLAFMIQSVLWGCGHNVLTAFRPQIVKKYACNDVEQMQVLLARSLQYTIVFLSIVTIPLLLCTSSFIRLWLGQVPPYVIILVQILLVDNYLGLINHTIYSAIQAQGNIRLCSLITGVLKVCCLPCAYLLLYYWSHPALPFIFDLMVMFLIIPINLHLLCRQIPLIQIRHLLLPMCRSVGICLACLVLVLPMCFLLQSDWLRVLIITSSYFLLTALGSFIFLLGPIDRRIIVYKLSCILRQAA